MAKLRILTLNLAFHEHRRWERLNLVVDEVKRYKPDVVMLQEVDLQAGVDKKLKHQLDNYYFSLGKRSGKQKKYGQLTLTKAKPVKQTTLALAQDRLALNTTIKVGTKTLNLLNVHLYFGPLRDSPRYKQAQLLLNFARRPAVIAGDFNATQNAKSIRLLKTRFNSAHSNIHSQEPARTYPTPLVLGNSPRTFLRLQAFSALGLLSKGTKSGWGVPIDYIFVEKNIKIVDCLLAFDKPSSSDQSLYASDHFGLLADLIF